VWWLADGAASAPEVADRQVIQAKLEVVEEEEVLADEPPSPELEEPEIEVVPETVELPPSETFLDDTPPGAADVLGLGGQGLGGLGRLIRVSDDLGPRLGFGGIHGVVGLADELLDARRPAPPQRGQAQAHRHPPGVAGVRQRGRGIVGKLLGHALADHHRLLERNGYIPPAEYEENYYRSLEEHTPCEVLN